MTAEDNCRESVPGSEHGIEWFDGVVDERKAVCCVCDLREVRVYASKDKTVLLVDLDDGGELVEGVHEGLSFTDHHKIISIEHFGKRFKGVTEDENPAVEMGQALVFLHEF